MSVHKFNPKLPRLGKGDFSTIILTHEFYQRAIKENPEYAHISWKKFQDIWIAIAEELKSEVCDNPLGVKLPFFLGDLKIQFLPYKKATDDKHLSQQEGEMIPHINIHSKGKAGKLIWERKDARRFNKVLDFWAYEPSDLFRADVGEVLAKAPEKFRIAKTRVANKNKVVNG